jgi:NCS1 family nucleobase:cation symporter-1
VGGVMICDYWLLRRTRLSLPDLYRVDGRYAYDRGVNFSALLAVAVAVAACVPGFCDTVTHGQILNTDILVGRVLKDLFSYGVFVTFALAFVLYAIFMATHPNVRMATESAPLLKSELANNSTSPVSADAVPQL